MVITLVQERGGVCPQYTWFELKSLSGKGIVEGCRVRKYLGWLKG